MSSKADQEEDYFARLDREKLAEMREKLEAEQAQQARDARAAQHRGHCGRCGGTFQTQLFKGVEIDLCPDCGAVLLDPGELEQLAGKDEAGVLSTLGELFSFTRRRG